MILNSWKKKYTSDLRQTFVGEFWCAKLLTRISTMKSSRIFFLNYLKSKWFTALPSPSVKINFLAKHNAKQTCSWKEREELVDNVWKFFEKAKVISLVLTIPEKCSSHFLLSTKINIAQRQESANSLCRASALTLYSRRTYVTAESKEAETMMHK